MTKPTYLYRHFDKDGKLLYIGISLSTAARLAQHRESASWFSSISTVTIEPYETRAEAARAEEDAIRREQPPHNRKHKGRRSARETSEVRAWRRQNRREIEAANKYADLFEDAAAFGWEEERRNVA